MVVAYQAYNPESVRGQLWKVAGDEDLMHRGAVVIRTVGLLTVFITAWHRKLPTRVHARLEPIMASEVRSL